jgi:hypothetical protein
MGSVKLHPEHGVNPCLDRCFYCGEAKGVALLGLMSRRITGEDKAPHHGLVFDREPCDKCKGFMKQGVIFIGIDEDRTEDQENPYRTGEFLVMADHWVQENVLPQELRDDILQRRMCFVQQAVCQGLLDMQRRLEEEEANDDI